MDYKFKAAQYRRDYPAECAMLKQEGITDDQTMVQSIIVFNLNKLLVETLNKDLEYLDRAGTLSVLYTLYSIADDVAYNSDLDEDTKAFFEQGALMILGHDNDEGEPNVNW